jgi:lipoprotein NlpD
MNIIRMTISDHKSKLQMVKILTACFVFSGCGTHSARNTPEPVSPQNKVYQSDTYRVQAGDTLFSLAWKNNTTVNKLRQINGMKQDSVLRAGQFIRLGGEPELRDKAPSTTTAHPPSKSCCLKKQPSIHEPIKKYEYDNRIINWVWPVKGRVVAAYSVKGGLNKGIDIQTKLGESVVAASDGEVVFAGNELKGYLNLVIVKHGARYLSAYSNNHSLLVKEGDKVRKGQPIAQMGKAPRAARLHFEIRADGKPVDPQLLLP